MVQNPGSDSDSEEESDKQAGKESQRPILGSRNLTSRRNLLKATGIAGGLMTGLVSPASASHSDQMETEFRTASQTRNDDAYDEIHWDRAFDIDYYYLDNNPVIVGGPMTYAGPNPGHMRFGNVDGDNKTFQSYLEEWDHNDDPDHREEIFHYLVLEEGSWNLDSGAEIQAGYVDLQDYDWVSQPLNIASKPVVFSTIGTFNGYPEDGGDAVTTRHQNVTKEGFDIRMLEQESYVENDSGHVQETAHVMAMEPGYGYFSDDKVYEAGFEEGVNHNWDTITWDYLNTDYPYFIAQIGTFNGKDPCSVRMRNLGHDSVEVKVEEDNSTNEVKHNDETIHYLAVESPYWYVHGEHEYQNCGDGDPVELANTDFSLSYHNRRDEVLDFCVTGFGNYYVYEYEVDICGSSSPQSALYSPYTSPILGMTVDVQLERTQSESSTALSSYDNMHRGGAFNGDEWQTWVDNNYGQTDQMSQVRPEWESEDFTDPDVPLWLAAGAAGIGLLTAASGITFPLVGGAAAVVGAADIGFEMAADSLGVNYQAHSDEHIEFDADINGRPLISTSNGFKLDVDYPDETNDFDVRINIDLDINSTHQGWIQSEYEWVVTIPSDPSKNPTQQDVTQVIP